jgi:replication-associated recombination protein RarA
VIVIIFGVSGAGKTTIGKLLAEQLGWKFYEADDFHPRANIEKMRSRIPPTDDDRWPWLDSLRQQIAQIKMLIKLTERESATIVVALRRWLSYPVAREADSIATSGGKYKPLDNGEIELLCKRITKKEWARAAPLVHQSTNDDGANTRVGTNRAIRESGLQHRSLSTRG